jgi:hypothetical protein
MLIERTDDGRGPFDELTGNIIFYAKNVMILPADMEGAYQEITLNTRTPASCMCTARPNLVYDTTFFGYQ